MGRFFITPTEDIDKVRELDAFAFPGIKFPADGEEHTWWLVHDMETGKVAGYCGAVYRPASGYVYLSRAAVAAYAQGHGLQRRMIRVRLRWARRQGANRVITYTMLKNYESICNLLKCGFRFDNPPEERQYIGDDVHYFKKVLT
jgi:GNAT superfamily N-acetyltransferase